MLISKLTVHSSRRGFEDSFLEIEIILVSMVPLFRVVAPIQYFTIFHCLTSLLDIVIIAVLFVWQWCSFRKIAPLHTSNTGRFSSMFPHFDNDATGALNKENTPFHLSREQSCARLHIEVLRLCMVTTLLGPSCVIQWWMARYTVSIYPLAISNMFFNGDDLNRSI